MNQEQINFKSWHYINHLREMLLDMATSNEFADVTLVSDDKKQFKAHKIVLSANSPAFKGIISDNPLSNSYIYLRGIQSLELEAILQFIYLGQATIDQERMDEFLDVAKSLEMKEITMKNTENEDLRENEFKEIYSLYILLGKLYSFKYKVSCFFCLNM